eukprot:TRINITY_DN2984_c0_g2_i1.p1 TRINITY_DN2984_c0_g2~~TRINITY_DN2984_c0_g2_i1.p1  ORF type:complete len:165 (+),score=52.01 TRINITY_DN2984_c0_g2_i1:107-601(+)
MIVRNFTRICSRNECFNGYHSVLNNNNNNNNNSIYLNNYSFGFPPGGDFEKIAKFVKQNLEDFEDQKKKIDESKLLIKKTCSAGADMVSMTLNGHGNIEEIKIDKELLKEGNECIIEDLIKICHNDAKKKVDEEVSKLNDPTKKFGDMFSNFDIQKILDMIRKD